MMIQGAACIEPRHRQVIHDLTRDAITGRCWRIILVDTDTSESNLSEGKSIRQQGGV
jgi:hypothetical protein